MKVYSFALALTALLIFATAAQAEKPTFPDPNEPSVANPQCGYLAGFVNKQGISELSLIAAKKISCKDGRSLMRQCFNKKSIKGWKASGNGGVVEMKKGSRRLSFTVRSGVMPRCGQRGGYGSNDINSGSYGPYQQPYGYPTNWPAPYQIIFDWSDGPIVTGTANIAPQNIVTVALNGQVHNVKGEARAVWFEYGKTRDLGTATEKAEPRSYGNDRPVQFQVTLTHLKAKQRYYWRAMANVDQPDGSVKEYQGAIGSFVTKPYPTLDSDQPCKSTTSPGARFEITESLAIMCTRPLHFTASSCYLVPCSEGYHGQIQCDKDYPRNLNAGGFNVNVRLPYVGVFVPVGSIDKIVSYWRSNNSNRFTTFFDTQKNSPGGEVGPIPGWHNWDVDQWSYPFTDTSTDAQFYISCTQQWGDVQSTDALIAGQGNDLSDNLVPTAAQNFKVEKQDDGSIKGNWDAPDADKTPGFKIAGYWYTPFPFQKGQKPALDSRVLTPVTNTTTDGSIPKAALDIYRKAFPSDKYDLLMMVVPVSSEGRTGTISTVPLPN